MKVTEIGDERPSRPTTKRLNALYLYDLPLVRDWLVYLTAFGVFAGARYAIDSYTPQLAAGLTRSTAIGLGIELAIAALIQFTLFGIVPGVVRRAVRGRRKHQLDQPGEPEPGIDFAVTPWKGILQVIALTVAVPTLAARLVTQVPVATQPERATCEQVKRVVVAEREAQSAANSQEARKARTEQILAFRELQKKASASGNDVMESEAVKSVQLTTDRLEAASRGDQEEAEALGREGDKHFRAIAAECRRVGQPLSREVGVLVD